MKEKYLDAKKYIKSIKASTSVFKVLNKYNEISYKLLQYNIPLNKYNILIENIGESDQVVVLDSIIKILEIYGIELHERTYQTKSKKDKYYRFINDNTNLYFGEIMEYQENSNDLFICMYKKHMDDMDNMFTNTLYDENKYIRITLENLSITEAIKELKLLYKCNNIKIELSNKELEDLYHYYVDTDKCTANSFINTVYNISIKYLIENNKEVIDKSFLDQITMKDKSISFNCTRLDDLVGLSTIKNEIALLKKYVNYCKKNNIDISKRYLNMFFIGNPGTGKTTVARALTDVFYELGLIKKNVMIETVPSAMQGMYVGHTQHKVKNILKDAEDGVLFIDEAYYFSSAKDNGGSFLKEALEMILKYMEDPSHIVIFSGYEKEMKELYKLNSGFKSRIYKEIIFDDYSDQELYEILKSKLKETRIFINNKIVKNKIIDLFHHAREDKNFGNARFCENLAQMIMINHINNDDVSLNISLNDIPKYKKNNKKYEMGFDYE